MLLFLALILTLPVFAENGAWLKPNDKIPFEHISKRTVGSPKSVNFSPDGKFLTVTSLGDNRIDVIDFATMNLIKKVSVAGKTSDPQAQGFAEGDFFPCTNIFCFSRMASGSFYEADLDNLDNAKMNAHETGGQWSKVVRFSPSGKSMAISNWESHTVTVFDYKTKNKIATFKNAHIPRGIVWLNEEQFAVTIFGDENAHKVVGGVEIFDIPTTKKSSLPVPHGMRDIKYDAKAAVLYVSSMRFGEIYRVDLKKCQDIDEWQKNNKQKEEFIQDCVHKIKVDDKPNTIQLNTKGTRLYVSCRGPNNTKGYTLRSPRSGYLYEIDTSEKEMKIVKAWQGGNQPTGLALSADGKYLAATDFMDARLTVYKLDSIKE